MTILRPEARPMEWGQMLEPQRRAFKKIVDFISHAVYAIPRIGTGWDSGLGHNALDFHRSNSVVMLSGKRGTGKTSLFLTLRRLARSADANTRNGESRFEKISSELNDQLRMLSKRVVWLETLDLEPLPHRSSLLSAIFARIEEVIRTEHGDWDGFDSWTENTHASGMEKAISDFDRLANEIAFAWDDGPGHSNHQNIEPEVYARELRRAERARLSIRQRLDDVLNQFARNVKWRNDVSNPLFILPVDDFDLNPKRCLELLRILRAIDGARLFTIVLGEQTTAAEVLDLKMYGELTQLVSHARFDDHQLRELSRHGKVLANEAIRKLLPPDQRVVLSPLSLRETLQFKPVLMGDELEVRRGELPSIQTLLNEVLINTFESGFRAMLEDTDVSHTTWPYRNEFSGLNALKGTVRQLTDLWIALDQIVKNPDKTSEQSSEIIRLFWREFSTALRAEPKLPDAWRDQLDLELRRFPPFTVELSLETRSLATRRISFRDELRFRLTKFESLIVGQSRENSRHDNVSEFYLGDDAKSAFVLMSDLIRADSVGRVTFVDHVRSIRELNLAQAQWAFHDQKLSSPWRGPVFRSFYSAEQFLHWWNRFSAESEGGRSRLTNDDINRMAYFWLLAGFAATTMEADDWDAVKGFAESSRKTFPKIGTKSHPVARLIGKISATSVSADAIDEWLTTVAVLLSPENGIPDAEIANRFKSNSRVNSTWHENAEFIRQERLEFAKSTQSTLLKMFLNPTNFEEEVRTRLVRTSYLASTFLSEQPGLPIMIDIKSVVDAFAERMTQVHQGFEDRFEKSSRFFDKYLPEALEACTKVRRRLEEYISPDDPFSNVGPFKRELSDFLSMLRDAHSLFEFLSASQLTQESTLIHTINKFEDGILCPPMSALRALE